MSADVTLIVGATDGIGLELARLHTRAGARLVLCGRRPAHELADPLFAGADVTYVQAELREPAAAARIGAALPPDAALARAYVCAAQGSYGPLENDAPEQIEALVAVNVVAPMRLAHTLAPRLLASGGTLVLLSSVAADLPCPDYAVYAATKAALDGFARSLAVEWRGRAHVQAVHPGAVRTGFHAKSGVPPELVASPRIPSAAHVAARVHALAGGR
ncbi:MAG: SDR family NAD(P)-dependent oxidoreductase, partial [Planctomycetota bacterium]|nr:SDR family NAD(P)-dependent oxidoreductase [Planctomycetota bacterium]